MAASEAASAVISINVDGADSAKDAAAALAKLNDQIVKDQIEARNLASAMSRLKSKDSEVVAQKEKLGQQFGALQKRIAQNSSAYITQGGKLGELGKATKDTASKTEKATEASDAAGLSTTKLASAAKVGALAVAAVGVAVAAAAVKLGQFGIAAADAARTQSILFSAWAGSEQQGAALETHVSKIASDTPLAKEQIQAYAMSLQQAGFGGKALTESLRAVSKTAGTFGQGAASKIQAIADKAKTAKVFMAGALDFQGTGLKLDDVASALAKNLGISMANAKAAVTSGRVKISDGLKAMADAATAKVAPFEEKLSLSLPNLANKLKDNLSGLFTGIPIEGFLGLLKSMIGLLDQNSATGKALKSILGAIFGPLDKSAKDATPAVVESIQRMVLAALKFATFVLRVKNSIKETFGGESSDKISVVTTALNMLMAAGIGVGIAIAAAAAPFVAFFAAMNAIENATRDATNYLKDLDWSGIASDLIDGFVDGIKAGVDRVVAAATSVGTAASDAAKKALGIASPSKVMFQVGGWTAEGMALGLDAGMPDVERSAGVLGRATAASASDAVASSASPEAGAGRLQSTSGGFSIQIIFEAGSIGNGANQNDIELGVTRAIERALQAQGLAA